MSEEQDQKQNDDGNPQIIIKYFSMGRIYNIFWTNVKLFRTHVYLFRTHVKIILTYETHEGTNPRDPRRTITDPRDPRGHAINVI